MTNIRVKSLLRFKKTNVVAVCCGLLDSSAWVASYAAAGSDSGSSYSPIYYAAAVPIKAAILLAFVRTVRMDNARILLPFFVPFGIVILGSIVLGNATLEGVVQPLGVLASLAMTIVILSDSNLAAYMKAFGVSSLAACLLFFFQLKFLLNSPLGVTEIYGRYTFVFGTHPNLGGEILFAGFVAFCVSRLKMVSIVALFGLYFVALSLVQSRAALLSLLVAFLTYVYLEGLTRFSLSARVSFAAVLAAAFGVFCVLNWESIADLLLLNDSYRGVGTGYVGREDRWEAAWEVFLQSPFVGVGFGYFRQDILTPHSLWLGMLSMMGLMSGFVLIQMLVNGARIYATNIRIFLLLLSFIPMTIFNDRFLNLNPYPFLMFVILFLPRSALLAGARSGKIGERWPAETKARRPRDLQAGVRIVR